jgi:predicted MFS family arabinose efflux permease
LGRRVNRRIALIVGIVGSGLSCLALGLASSLFTFAIDIFAYWIFCMFLYSYLLGTAAVLDSAGRVGTLGGGLEKLGVAGGVFAAGQLAQHATYSATGVLGLACCLLGLTIGFPSVFRALARLEKEPATPVLLRE